MEPNEIVAAIMITFAIAYLLLEVLLNINDIDNDTTNLILLEWSKGKAFIIPFLLGAIGGHLFLGTTDPDLRMAGDMYPVFILFGIAIIAFVIGFTVRFEKSISFLTGLLILGLLYGHFLWSMNNKPAI